MICGLVDILFSYERDASGSWEEVVAIFKNPTANQLAAKIGCSKGCVKGLLDGDGLSFKGKVYYLVSHVVE